MSQVRFVAPKAHAKVSQVSPTVLDWAGLQALGQQRLTLLLVLLAQPRPLRLRSFLFQLLQRLPQPQLSL